MKSKLDISKLENVIKSPDIRIVSFDIFDTLLIRPCCTPRDIFCFMSAKSLSITNEDFFSPEGIRVQAEKELQKTAFPTIDEIWEHIRKKTGISAELAESLKRIEVETEEELLYPRERIKELYLLAVKYKKKIIAVSDMYIRGGT